MPVRRHLEDLFGGQPEQSWPKGIESVKTNAPGAALVDLTEALDGMGWLGPHCM